MRKLGLVGLLVTLVVLGLVCAPFSYAKYPEKPITVFVGFPAGGPTDVIARGILPIVQEKLGVGIGIQNVPGAASAIAAKQVLSRPADGYTLMFGSEAMSTWQVMGTADMSPYVEFVPIRIVAEAIPVLAVPPNSPFKSAEEFIKYAKENPGKLKISTAGPATVPHVSGLLLQKYLGCKFTFVPYRGGKPAVTAAMGGHVDATIEMVQSMVEAHKSGLIRILASFTNEPVEGLDVPPIGKLFPELSSQLPYGPYFGLFAPRGVPKEVIEVLTKAMDEAAKDQRWLSYCKKFFLVPVNYSGREAYEYVKNWTAKCAWLLYDTGVAKNSPEKFGIKRPQ
ncbi:MAG: tripartite tricarboxylate transporter substrate binding protein [Synergistetes bacterium]|nr:MAG: hypothetical protein XD52_0821 [bacterium 42_11]MBC7330953.1 tripartite tricarboxylate transporter substrate binding protein [Synergistota bacterium]